MVGEVVFVSISEVSVFNEVNEELLEVVVVIFDIVVEVIVGFLVGVIMVVKKVLVIDVVVEGGFVDVVVINVLVVTGVGVELIVVSREWGKVGVECILFVWLFSVLLVERDKEDVDVIGRFVVNGFE